MQWVREEALASIQVVEFVELPEVVMSHAPSQAAVDEELPSPLVLSERLQRQLSVVKVQRSHAAKPLVLNDFLRIFPNTWRILRDASKSGHTAYSSLVGLHVACHYLYRYNFSFYGGHPLAALATSLQTQSDPDFPR